MVIRRLFNLGFFLWLATVSICTGQQINNDFVDGEIYVRLKAQFARPGLIKTSSAVNIVREIPTIQRAVENLNSKIDYAVTPFYKSKNEKLKNVYRIKIDNEQSMDQILKDLKEDGTIEYAERVRKREVIGTPTDTLYNQQWHLDKIKAPQAWDVNPGVQNIIVAVVDNAFDITHPDLAANLVSGYDVGDNDSDPRPLNASYSHGTHVAGIVAAVNNNITGGASASNNRVKVMPVKGNADIFGNRAISHGFEGIIWAVDHGAKIISLSWGGSGFSQLEQDVVDDAYGNGALIIAAAGNESSNVLQYPAAYNHVMAVASLDMTDQLSSFSSFGSYVDISAPGRGIISTIPFNAYASFNGTSMATPLVAACAGYLKACFSTLSSDSIAYILEITSDDIEDKNPNYIGSVGSGRVNLLTAVSCKGVNLFSESPFALSSNYLCKGDSVLFDINPVSTESFEWFFNGTSVSNAKSVYAKTEGSYKLVRTLGTCVVESEVLKVVHNQNVSPRPSVTDLSAFYCSSENNFVVATPTDCDAYGPSSFDYVGPVVGFDGFEKSGDYPQVTVSNLGGLIDSISVSITWQKKDGGTHNNCDVPDGGGSAFNEEVSFSIVSPEGVKVDLVRVSDYGRGSGTSGVVTTVFNVHGQALIGDPLPASGNFKASGDLSVYQNMIPQGKWTLIADDDATLDPLCVSGFSVIIKTKEPVAPPSVKWYADEALTNFLSNNDTLTISTANIGTQNYYALSQCEGFCTSLSEKAKVKVKSIPDVYAYPIGGISLNSSEINKIVEGSGISASSGSGSLTLSGLDKNNVPYSYKISSTAPQVSPVTLCTTESYLIFGLGCSGTIEWKHSGIIKYGDGVVLNNVKTPLNLTATCLQSWNCPAITNIPFSFQDGNTPLTLSGQLNNSSEQFFYGKPISSSQQIGESSHIKYVASNSILLTAGFETKETTVFKAEIGNCPN